MASPVFHFPTISREQRYLPEDQIRVCAVEVKLFSWDLATAFGIISS